MVDNTALYTGTLQQPLNKHIIDVVDDTALDNKEEEKQTEAFTPNEFTKKLLEKGNNQTLGEELANYELDNNNASYGVLEGMWAGAKSSITGSLSRYALADMSVSSAVPKIGAPGGLVLTRDELLEIAKEADYDPFTMKAAIVGSATLDEVKAKLQIKKDNAEIERRLGNSGVMTNIASTVTNIVGDPLMLAATFIPFGGQAIAGSRLASFGARFAFNASTQVPLVLGSEYLNEKITGREAEYWNAAAITAGIGSVFALGAFRRGAVRGAERALTDAQINKTISQRTGLAAADNALAELETKQIQFEEDLIRQRQAASLQAQGAHSAYKQFEAERATMVKSIQEARKDISAADDLVKEAEHGVQAAKKEAEEAYARAQDEQLDHMLRLEEAEKSLKAKQAENSAKLRAKKAELTRVKKTLERTKSAVERRAVKNSKLLKKGVKPSTAGNFAEDLVKPLETRVAELQNEIKYLKGNPELKAAEKGIKELKANVKKAAERVKEAKNARTASGNSKIKLAETGLKDAKELAQSTRDIVKELSAKHKELVAKSKDAKEFFETSRNATRKLRSDIQHALALRAETMAARRSIQQTRKLPLDTAVQKLNHLANRSLEASVKARLGRTTARAASEALQNRGLMKEGDDLATVMSSEVTEADVRAAREAAARTTGDSLADTVMDNPSLKNHLAKLLSNPTKVLELKAYFVSLLDSPTTPQSLKNLIHKLVHFEEGVKSADGRYRQYQSSAPTYTENLHGFKVEDEQFINRLNTLDNKIRVSYPESELDDISDYIYSSLEGNTIRAEELALKYGKDENIKEFIAIQRASYEQRGYALRSRGILAEEADSALYSPLVIDTDKLFNFLSQHFKGNVDKAKAFIANYLVDGVLKDPTFRRKMLEYYYKTEGAGKAAMPERLTPFEESKFRTWLNRKAKEAAEGYVDQGRSIPQSAKVLRRAERMRDAAGFENYDDFANGFAFLKERLPWNVGHVTAIDGKTFSVNNLRVDPIDAHYKYRARSTGILTDFDTFDGKSFDEVEQMFFEEGAALNKANNMKPNLGEDFHRNATMLHKRAYGISVTETQEAFGILDAAAQIVRNLAFSSFGTYMGLNSLMELSRALRATGFVAALKLVPFANTLFSRWANNGFTRSDINSIRGYLLGQTMRPLLGYRTSLHNGVRKYSSATGSNLVNGLIGKIVGFSDYVADRSPAGLLLRGINTKIDDVFETYGMKEILQRAFDPNVKVPRGCFMSDDTLRKLNISKQEFNQMLKDLKGYFIRDKHGNFSLNPNLSLEMFASNNRKSLYIFRRLMQHVRETTMQRRNIDDIFLYERSSKNSLISLAMQFKAFSINSYRKRLIKTMHQFTDGEADLVAEQYLISACLAGMVTLGTTYVRGLGMSDEDKGRYYKRTLGIESFDDLDDEDNLARFLGSITVNRMSEVASLSLMANLAGIGSAAKTTYGTTGFGEDDEDDSLFIHNKKIGQNLLNMFPAINALQNMTSGAIGAVNLGVSKVTGSDMSYSEGAEQTRLIQSLITTFPNVPFFSNALKDKAEEAYSRPF